MKMETSKLRLFSSILAKFAEESEKEDKVTAIVRYFPGLHSAFVSYSNFYFFCALRTKKIKGDIVSQFLHFAWFMNNIIDRWVVSINLYRNPYWLEASSESPPSRISSTVIMDTSSLEWWQWWVKILEMKRSIEQVLFVRSCFRTFHSNPLSH